MSKFVHIILRNFSPSKSNKNKKFVHWPTKVPHTSCVDWITSVGDLYLSEWSSRQFNIAEKYIDNLCYYCVKLYLVRFVACYRRQFRVKFLYKYFLLLFNSIIFINKCVHQWLYDSVCDCCVSVQRYVAWVLCWGWPSHATRVETLLPSSVFFCLSIIPHIHIVYAINYVLHSNFERNKTLSSIINFYHISSIYVRWSCKR